MEKIVLKRVVLLSILSTLIIVVFFIINQSFLTILKPHTVINQVNKVVIINNVEKQNVKLGTIDTISIETKPEPSLKYYNKINKLNRYRKTKYITHL